MSANDLLIIYGSCIITILVCRVGPLFMLKGRELSLPAQRALGLIPPAAFAALVANDLFSPTMFESGMLPGLVPVLAGVVVALVALKSKSLIACVIVGVGSYVALLYAFGIGL